jgi:hypothetical protein
MKNYIPFLLFLFSMGIFACRKKNASNFFTSVPGNVNIYATGYQDSLSTVTLKYWENGIPVTLPCQANPNDHGITTSGIVVSGIDVYVCGNDFNDLTGFSVATYWKNGSRVAIGNTTGNTYANSIVISGSDVYVAGYEARFNRNTNLWYIYAIYWKNGNPIILGDTLSQSYANSIVVSGNDIYIGGTRSYDSVSVATYWKNGTLTDLTDTSIYGGVTTILLSGSSIYQAWVESNNSGAQVIYGTNGMSIPLQGAPGTYGVNSIVASGNDIYASGNFIYQYGSTQATYWKNGNQIKLTNSGPGYSKANSIAISGDDVYVGGRDNSYGGVIWKNGIEEVFPASFTITSICLSSQ